MLSLTVHALLGVGVVWLVVHSNPAIFRRTGTGPLLSPLEIALYAVGIVSIGIGWYFNIRFVTENTDGWFTNPFVGDGSWEQYLKLLFDNPAAGSASGDFITANVVLLPLITIVGGLRRGIQRPWLFFVVTLFASFSSGWAFYAATVERQRRLQEEDGSGRAVGETISR
ncbi:MAG TPA: DUF2834 domain-containing protein [Marmoricola sp.]|nr:DUF2834 domain-containing protein [Marmoricola sp.]